MESDVRVDVEGMLRHDCPKCDRQDRKVEELVPDIRRMVERGIHATMLSVVQTINNQKRNHPNLMENQIYWDAINLTFTLDFMTEHFLKQLDDSIKMQEEVDAEAEKMFGGSE
jgi:hypothetical protein